MRSTLAALGAFSLLAACVASAPATAQQKSAADGIAGAAYLS